MIHIYKIVDTTLNIPIYVGQTSKDIKIRFEQHKNDILYLDKYLYLQKNDCKIVLIEDSAKEYAHVREQFYIDLYEPKLNRINAYYNKYDAMAKATKKAKNIIKNLNKK